MGGEKRKTVKERTIAKNYDGQKWGRSAEGLGKEAQKISILRETTTPGGVEQGHHVKRESGKEAFSRKEERKKETSNVDSNKRNPRMHLKKLGTLGADVWGENLKPDKNGLTGSGPQKQ